MKTYVALIAIALTITHVNGDKIDTAIPCGNTSHCRNTPLLPPDAFCKDGYCMCPNVDNGIKNCSSLNASMHENKLPGPLVYRTCKHNQDCNFEGGFCNSTNSQCYCTKDYVPSSSKQRCVRKASSIEASCTDDNQCLGFLANTTCQDNKCVCAPDYHYIDNACWIIIKYGEACLRNQECSHIEGAICTDDMTCGCAAETVLNTIGNRCLAAAKKIQDECIESVQCVTTFENSLCIDKKCQCEPNYHYERDMARCFLNAALDNECSNNYECYQAEDYENDPPIKSVMCENNRCTCADSFVRGENRCVSAGSSVAASLSLIFSVITLTCGILLS